MNMNINSSYTHRCILYFYLIKYFNSTIILALLFLFKSNLLIKFILFN